jgi:hypothetical protein
MIFFTMHTDKSENFFAGKVFSAEQTEVLISLTAPWRSDP